VFGVFGVCSRPPPSPAARGAAAPAEGAEGARLSVRVPSVSLGTAGTDDGEGEPPGELTQADPARLFFDPNDVKVGQRCEATVPLPTSAVVEAEAAARQQESPRRSPSWSPSRP
jgi:hypothetical protein